MKPSRRRALTAGVGALAGLGAGFALQRAERRPRAWSVTTVDCAEPILDAYDGDRFYATLLESRREARDRLRTTECFDPYREEYFALDYDAYVVSVRVAALPEGRSTEVVAYEFDGDTLWYTVEVTGGSDGNGGNGSDDAGTVTLRQVVTTWELNDAEKPSRVRLVVRQH